ncbi:hypothetical protein GT348_08985 (plasmid) [Aristophania vespae]|uniref:Uncharacterized protein n=1 Tax=Aristophania vespae TaxID=2697033 RepID=A0A6P1NLH5_9PROT|nr:hypothetical protein [Aristophania vespae]QHI96482.1 hypothetical protein GT348_08985 [Aristophania vespae]
MTSLPFSSTPSIMSMPQAQPKMPSVNAAATDDKLKKTAQDFESVALGELLQPMFETVDTSKGMFGGERQKVSSDLCRY